MTVARELGIDQARAQLERAGQEHVLRFYDDLDEERRRELLEQVASLDLESLADLAECYVHSSEGTAIPADVEPAPYFPLHETGLGSWDRAAAQQRGETLIREGKIAAFTVAGGQGTRLGFDRPKGTFPGSAVTRKPLFACLAEWITAAQSRYGLTIPWYIMTSPLNHEATVRYFEEQTHFGLDDSAIMFFNQGVVPSLDLETGNLILAEKHRIATNPDGHGGSLRALAVSGALDDMRARGVEHISYVQIDNPLARVIDAMFIGLHAGGEHSSGEMSSKMVAKTDPAEKVGVFARAGRKTLVLEYSDLPEDLARARRADGGLQFNAGSIAIHMISVKFAQKLNAGGDFALSFHRAEKKVPYVELENGKRIEPEVPNAVKLEAFVFDALPLCDSSIVMETDRIEEFAPIKNAEGQDSPESSRQIQTERAARWLELAGLEVPRDMQGAAECTLELSPLTAMRAEDLQGRELPESIERGAEVAL